MIAFAGVAALFAIAVALSANRRAINWRIVLSAFALQAGFAVIVLYLPWGQAALGSAALGVQEAINFTDRGTRFLFGDLYPEREGFFSVALNVLPVIVFVSSLASVLYYLRIMQAMMTVIGGGLRRVIGVTRVEAVCAAANIFIGMVESPLVIRPFLARLSHSQLFTVMGLGLSSVSGAILIGYASLGIDSGYLVAAAFMAAPGGIVMAKLLHPEDDAPHAIDQDDVRADSFDPDNPPANLVQAAADGAMAGLRVAVAVGAMLICFVALLAMANALVGWVGGLAGLDGLTLEAILGWLLAPLMFLLGIPWEEAVAAGNLVGQKTILNEFIAFVQLAEIRDTLSEHTVAVVTFALCGFANLTALAIIMGGLGNLIPERRGEVSALGLRAVLCGSLSNLMSAALASILLSL
ncbi:NupC/NupG family nucleoside CNT transporter [Rhodothalassium salexigens]|uniref:NupC/NupG family nucleoside CNT transporter n=1 Tax=Rhodothalassium salexigens TaxID=1086 RepID=UPI001914AE16|nr:nucleoside transporter C-terminal domain-containing protein [Rhodothalassium salexigens]MBK5911754.1 NupC/NupG family nucleoside CNT transporter [Rhodothalassium salexigens]MBK5920458.1 NupC/NupG family nucleoside CNT transporter [Rhodothalassium salexigens]